jgi:NAD(P)-dependent dehydrogenase (short-subunit alcohol dehydrogenase family)
MSREAGVARLSKRLPGRRAFITGAASGLGRAFAFALARDGWQLGLADLAAERLERVRTEVEAGGGGRATVFTGDVSSHEFVEAALGSFARDAGGLDLVINNAGVAVAGPVETTSAEDWRWAVEINLLGVVHGCRAAVPLMRRQASGAILNIASSAGFAAAPHMGAYNASKAGVIALSETLACELHGSGVQVSVAMPGFFRTGLLETMRAPAGESALARRLMEGSAYDAADAARAILAATARGDLYIVWPAEYRWLWRLKRFVPMPFLRRVQRMRVAQAARSEHPRPG